MSDMLVQLTADDLRVLIREAVAEHLTPSAWLSLSQLSAEFGFSRESLASAARDGLSVRRGPKGRLMVRRVDVEEWLLARPWTPRARRQDSSIDLDAHDTATLRLLQGGSR